MAIHHLVVSALLALSYLQRELQTKEPNLNSTEWQMYKQEFGKTYDSQEVDSMRKLIFFASKLRVEKYNKEHEHLKGRVNHLSDWTEEEKKRLLGVKIGQDTSWRQNSAEGEKFLREILARNVEVPEELDWRKVPNRVSAVKDQGYCGSCWAFSAIGTIEGQEATQKNVTGVTPLSEQNLVDCVYRDRSGCHGGLMHDGVFYVRDGVQTGKDYPYVGYTLAKCHYVKSKSFMNDSGVAFLPEGDEETLKQVVANFGPVSVGMIASLDSFYRYYTGVYFDDKCPNDFLSIDHGVLIVGYGHDKESKLDYWIVKNSWGPEWGDGGYIKVARNRNNTCGIATYAIIPTFKIP